jgi:hypothetical protein
MIWFLCRVDLPEQQKVRAAECLASSLEPDELKRAFQLTMDSLLEQVRFVDSGLATNLERPLNLIVDSLVFE